MRRHRSSGLSLAVLVILVTLGACSQSHAPARPATAAGTGGSVVGTGGSGGTMSAIACPLDVTDGSGTCWESTAPYGSGAWPDEWRPGKFPLGLVPLVAFRGELWMIGRPTSWSSADGLTWAPHATQGDWGSRIAQAHVFFNGQLWMFGGLAYDSRVFLNDVWSSPDGEHWGRAGEAAWPAREGPTVIAFLGKLWLMGGAVHVAEDRSPDQFVNDVWSSEDGVAWTQVTGAAPWPAMDVPRVLVFRDALYLLGGQGHAQVWRSSDGVQWTQLSAPAAWGDRFDHGAQLFDRRLWVYGGEPAPRDVRRPGTPVRAFNDIWYSEDGVTWLRQTEHGPWSPRSGLHSVVFNERLWLFSGKHTGATDNWGGDIWTMRLQRAP